MKKILSLLCAALIVLSASAAPMGKLTKASMKKAQKVEAKQVMPAAQLVKAHELRAAKSTPVAVAKRAAKVATNLVADDVHLTYYSTSEDWYLQMLVGQTVFVLDVYSANASELEDGTYTVADMDLNYCGVGQVGSQYLTDGFSDATLVVSSNENGKCYSASVVTETDGAEYVITFEAQAIPEPTEFVELTFDAESVKLIDVIASQGAFQFVATSDDVEVGLAFSSTSIEGDYTTEDALSNNCYVVNGTTQSRMADVTATVVAIEGGFEVTAEYLGWDAVLYTISFTYMYPVAGDPIDIVADMEIAEEPYFGLFTITEVYAESEDGYEVSMEYWGSLVAGTYTEADEIDITVVHPNGQDDAIETYSITYAVSGSDATLTGTLVGSYGQEYNITLTYALPEAGRQETITISNGVLIDATATEYAAFLYEAVNAQAYVTGYVLNNAVAGDYTLTDFYVENTFIATFAGADTLYFDPLAADVHVAVSGQTATITGTMLCQNYYDNSDVVEFTLNITCVMQTYEEPTGMQYDAEDADFVGSFTAFEFDRTYLEEYGSIMLDAYTETAEIVLDFNLINGTEDPAIVIPAGVYTIDDTYDFGTVTASAGVEDGSVYASFAANVEGGQLVAPLWFLEEGTVTVTNQNGHLHVVVDALNSYGRHINVTIDETGVEAIDNVEAGAKAVKMMKNGQLVIERNGVEYNAVGAKL